MKIKVKDCNYKIKVNQCELDLICALLENTSEELAKFFGINIDDIHQTLLEESHHYMNSATIKTIKLEG